MGEIHIVLAPEKLTELWGIPITNSLLTSWVVTLLLVGMAFAISRNIQLVPGRVQVLFESLFEFVLKYTAEVLESEKLARRFFPLLMTIFIFIFAANILEFTPGIGSIGLVQQGEHGEEELIPLFRSVNSDLTTPLALAFISFIVTEITGVAVIGVFKYWKKFVNFKSVLGFFIGLIELMSEIMRLITFSFRLFGNIFAGEVLIIIAIAFVPFILPVPFMLFEVFVGFIQAAIFSLLTLFFIKIAITETH